jgi:predicted kinase
MKELILLRGLPGSGKSTFAKIIGGEHYEADMFFMRDGEYKFDPEKIKMAHEWCRTQVMQSMVIDLSIIVVSNTFTMEWEMDAYYELAKQYGYRVHSIIVENRHGGVNEHGVPKDKLAQMQHRFEVKL